MKTPAAGLAVLMLPHRVFCSYTPGQRTVNRFPVARAPWNWGLPRFIAIWHLIWRPRLGSTAGLSTINHARRQQHSRSHCCSPPTRSPLTHRGRVTPVRVLRGSGCSTAGEPHGDAGTKTHPHLFVANKPSPKRLQSTCPAA